MDAQHQLSGWWRSALLSISIAGSGAFFWQATTPTPFEKFAKDLTATYAAMDPDPSVLELEERLDRVPAAAELMAQKKFFDQQDLLLQRFDQQKLSAQQRNEAELIRYIIDRNMERLELEIAWNDAGRPRPIRGLEGLPTKRRWYEWLVKRYTGTAVTPQEVMALGEKEIDRCRRELAELGQENGDAEGSGSPTMITEKLELIAEFERIDSITRSHLRGFAGGYDVPPVHAMEWPGAGPNTPPGMYLPREHNAYGTDVFQINFHDHKFDRSALSWIYLHEAIPGHHLQASIRRDLPITDLRAHLFEPGNFEGWACYVEYYGDMLGLYGDPVQRSGKWEWDLVRSVRLVLDVGIHYESWSREQALDFWKQNITGQDAIAEREVDRVTAMPGQVLSYKVGAAMIEQIKENVKKEKGADFNLVEFHQAFLEAGALPLILMEDHIMLELGVG